MDEQAQGRSPPKQLVELRIQSGEGVATLNWEPRTGTVGVLWTGGPGNVVALSRRFKKMKVERASDFIRVAHEFISAAFGEPGAREDVQKVVGSMMSLLPGERDSEGTEKRESHEGTGGGNR